MVVNGAGAAAIACAELVKAMGVRGDHITMCDRKGVLQKGRTDLDQWKSAHAVETEARTLADACAEPMCSSASRRPERSSRRW